MIRRPFILLLLGATLGFAYWSIPLPTPLFPPDYSTVVLDTDGHFLRVFLNQHQQWCLPPNAASAIPTKLETAVLFYEDRYFYRHPGVNPLAILRALKQNATAGTTISGASTLTMQVARLMQPKPRTIANKTLESLQALKIEAHYSKTEILRFYLDHAPYGGNIVGYQAAAWRYFGKKPNALSWGEAATLAVLPNAPGLVSPLANAHHLKRKRDRLLRRLKNAGHLTPETYQLALLEPTPQGARPFPLYAPHLARRLHHKHAPATAPIRTTLHRPTQRRVEALVREHLDYLSPQGIANGAVLVANTRSNTVSAYVGSPDFFDRPHHGQVDGVTAPRSSGSILKPFLYALAMDAGLILPQSLIEDLPTQFGSFAPQNADEGFDGLIDANQALVRSRNVPAVALLQRYGLYPFHHFLKTAGVRTLFRTADEYGLPLIIGGAEVTLWDMTALYTGLANGGTFTPLRLVATDSSAAPNTAHLSPGACYLTLEMLRQVKRPGAEFYWQQYQDQWPLAWKTGTSYGHRDAWAIGVNPQWTIAVWVGNFSGEGNPALTGARSAGPLLFDIFNALPKEQQHAWFSQPEYALAEKEICFHTGYAAGPHCPRKIWTPAPAQAQSLALCPYHRTLHVTTSETHQVCSLCWSPGTYKRIQRLHYPAPLAQYMRHQGRLGEAIPPHKPDCPAQNEVQPITILYPRYNARLWLPRDFGGRLQEIVLRVAHRDGTQRLFWYLDDRFIGTTQDRHMRSAPMDQGWHVLEVVDEAGHRDRTRFHVDRMQG